MGGGVKGDPLVGGESVEVEAKTEVEEQVMITGERENAMETETRWRRQKNM